MYHLTDGKCTRLEDKVIGRKENKVGDFLWANETSLIGLIFDSQASWANYADFAG